MTREEIAAIRARADAATAGPWRFEVNQKSKEVRLCGGKPTYDLTVMDFVRWGMSGAILRLRDMSHDGMNLMGPCTQWAKKLLGREHHAEWFKVIEHPDTGFIESARTDVPNLCDALLAAYDEIARLDAECAEARKGRAG